MHIHKLVMRNIACAAALVTIALPLAGPLASTSTYAAPAQQQLQPAEVPTGCTPSTANTTTGGVGTTSSSCYVDARLQNGRAVAFNPIGVPDTATFVCDALVNNLYGNGGTAAIPTVPPGCYNVTASVSDLTSGGGAAIDSATCGNRPADISGSSVNCSGVASPICPVGTRPSASPGPTTPCLPNCPAPFTFGGAGAAAGTCTGTIGANGTFATPAACTAAGGTPNAAGTLCTFQSGFFAENTATVTIKGTNHIYSITFSGYVPTTTFGNCPAGTTQVPGTVLNTSFGSPPTSFQTGATGACRFSVLVTKKFVEITKITLTQVPGTSCGGNLFYVEGLKAFFGPRCQVVAVATGTVVIKTGDCSQEPNGTPAPADFGVGAVYACVNGNLVVNGTTVPGVNLTYTVNGPGSFNVLNNLGTGCAGAAGATTTTAPSGTPVSFCGTGPGGGSIQACLATPLPNNQPQVCSNTLTFTFTQTSTRVVPQVRWAGEKIALTKCFGPGLAGTTVEFLLKSNQASLAATLVPTDLGSTLAATGIPPSNSTIYTVTDENGCASVIGFADGEGVLQVDAAIFSTTSAGILAGTPLVNEHVFQVFYLKFDHLDLENINPTQTYSTSTSIGTRGDPTTFLGLVAGSPAVKGAKVFPANFTLPSPPGANGEVAGPTGYAVPLCQTQYVRAMVHGYFEYAGDPSGRPATSVAIPGAPLSNGGTPSAGSYVLPAGRWVLPEDWPVLATFAGISNSFTPSSVLFWDLNSGFVFNPGGEAPVLCTGAGTFAPDALANGTGEGAAFSNGDGGFGAISASAVDTGPCFGIDGAGNPYATAGPGGAVDCTGGITVGIGPYDPTQTCTSPLNLPYKPTGGLLVGGTGFPFACTDGTAGPCLVPNGLNSTYLPNGTLNQWDAPMPAAEISFGITKGPGYLSEVNKTGLYSLIFDVGKPVGGACPTGYAVSPVTGTCHLDINPDPFYSTAIPASPFIPNPVNNGGYLWNSWNFSAGTTTVVRSSPNCFSNAPAGGCVPGQSTTVTFATGAGAVGPLAGSDIAATCAGPAAGLPFFLTATATTCTVPGGTNITTCVTTGTTDNVVVADGSGFLPGMTLEVYSTDGVTPGATVATGIVVQTVIPAPQPGFPNAVELVFATGVLGCLGADPGTYVFIAEQFGIPVPSAAPFVGQEVIDIGNGANGSLNIPISESGIAGASDIIDLTNNIVYVDTTAAVALHFGPCTGAGNGVGGALGDGSGISRAGGPAGNPFCEPNLLVPPGTIIETGPVGAGGIGATQTGTPPNPYPFWQFVAAPPTATQAPATGTVYSDNHGEAVVALQTAIATQILPVNGACPKPYVALGIGGTIVSCQLPFGVLGALGFGNVSKALSGFSAAKPGCIQTFPSGTYAVLPNATIGATGPTAGQICINNQGGIEFGASAALGSTTVQAVADYPYFREHGAIASAPLTKVFTSAFAKTLTVSAGTPAPAGFTNYTVTVTARDVCGFPLFGEPVQVYAVSGNNSQVVLAPISAGVVLSANSNSAVVTVDPATGQAVLSLEVLGSSLGSAGLVIKVVFPFEKVERFVTVIPGSTPGATVNVPYAPGWQMVGGPTNTNFGVAEALFSYDPTAGQYTNASASASSISSAAPSCTGYWAYFAAAMVVAIPATSKSGDTAACTLKSGFNLVGNPFGTPATLPSGVTAYHWNGTSYDTQGTIPVGGSVWVYNDGTLNTLTLTAT